MFNYEIKTMTIQEVSGLKEPSLAKPTFPCLLSLPPTLGQSTSTPLISSYHGHFARRLAAPKIQKMEQSQLSQLSSSSMIANPAPTTKSYRAAVVQRGACPCLAVGQVASPYQKRDGNEPTSRFKSILTSSLPVDGQVDNGDGLDRGMGSPKRGWRMDLGVRLRRELVG